MSNNTSVDPAELTLTGGDIAPADQLAAFDLDGLVAQAEARLIQVNAEREVKREIKTQTQAAINRLNDEEKRLRRFIAASTPRKSAPRKPAAPTVKKGA